MRLRWMMGPGTDHQCSYTQSCSNSQQQVTKLTNMGWNQVAQWLFVHRLP
jgi:hypothetical protein